MSVFENDTVLYKKNMKNIKYLLFFAAFVMLSSCLNKVNEAADYICECNQGLVNHIEKLEKLKKENDVNSLAEMQPESERIANEAKECYKRMQAEFGSKTMNNKDFEIQVLSVVEEQCPAVFKYRNQILIEE